MKAVTKITFLDESGDKFFGEGPARLLQGIQTTGSLRAAALSMNMAYSKALKLLKNAESALGFPLTTRTAGGRSGGGSVLTPEGQEWLSRYEAYATACAEENRRLFRQFFPKIGCVIMASGLGRRFGGNKLMADFDGHPMILRALDASEGLGDNRVVVTRHEAVADLCRARNVPVIFHSLPHRSDTVRLGLEALGDVDGCLFLPGDQPLLRGETVDALVRAWEADQESIFRPFCDGQPGSPVLFPRWTFPELMDLPEGKGGGWLIRKYPDRVKHFPISDPWELRDADTPEALDLLKQQSERSAP